MVGHESFETAQEADADIQPECAGSIQQHCPRDNLRSQARRHSPQRFGPILAMYVAYQREYSLVRHYRCQDQPHTHYDRTLSEDRSSYTEQENPA